MSNFEQLYDQYNHYIEITVDKMFPNKELLFHIYGIDEQDLMQIGRIGFWEAVETYDERKSNIKTHIINRVTWKLLNYIRRLKAENDISIENEQLVIADNRDLDKMSNYETMEIVERELTDHQIYILEEMMNGFTQSEIAKNIGCCRTMVTREYKMIKKKMEKYRELLIK